MDWNDSSISSENIMYIISIDGSRDDSLKNPFKGNSQLLWENSEMIQRFPWESHQRGHLPKKCAGQITIGAGTIFLGLLIPHFVTNIWIFVCFKVCGHIVDGRNPAPLYRWFIYKVYIYTYYRVSTCFNHPFGAGFRWPIHSSKSSSPASPSHWGAPQRGGRALWATAGGQTISQKRFVDLTDWTNKEMGLGQYLLIPFLVGWTSIYQLFWGSLGTRVLTHPHLTDLPSGNLT